MRTLIEVAAALVFRDRKLLITQRFPEAHLGGLWEFPGGKREVEESFETCLRRELLEELGIEVRIDGLVEDVTHHYPEKSVRLQFYRCQWSRNEPQKLGCPDFRWVAKEELSDFEFPAADAAIVARLTSEDRLWS